ncbi:CRISPR-associated helicase Cas3' [Ruegeria sp. PrR005]|uniref:CRISPR-associated helicase Cas3 n=1 Tax=Ruegeria sp. PrR005 TaxID=2706882 RepID=A0A6B2NUQ8_9RHOB|nr:CRISPR-associated helicase Cas3' [Ruegeria sp. PrR005]NDW46347.1 CRISPR-associated helicase Cas3' [Ruegeria sp. PrR005]
MTTTKTSAKPVGAWGKATAGSAETHHLAHHSADVAAVFLSLMAQPIWATRASTALGRMMSADEISCLGALVFIHDIGKLAPGFQAKAWPDTFGLRLIGHLEAGWHWAAMPRENALAGAASHLAGWPNLREWFAAMLAHHGRPVPMPSSGEANAAYPVLPDYDWRQEEALLGRCLLDWFPAITRATAPPPEPRLVHLFCGLLTLADWVASDRRAFEYAPRFSSDYWHTAQIRARARVAEIGLAVSPPLRGPADWSLISDHSAPRPAQQAVKELLPDERLILLEAETGSGKTEAALWHFAALLEAGKVDALYFAVPTRAAARQLHGRINKALRRMFETPPEAVLAIPGQAVAGEAKAQILPGFELLWDDGAVAPQRWAAEHSARYLAARVAVGTVDQMALGGLQIKFAHLRGASLSRALLVIDEVHASDPYMTEIQRAMVQAHLDLGGYAFLMSATLGAVARRRWRNEAPSDLISDANLPYPAVWTSKGLHTIPADPGGTKVVQMEIHSGWSGAEAAQLAEDAAKQGARVLVVRNTVVRAQETFAVCSVTASDMLLSVKGIPTLHHSRFAPEDRAMLDRAVEQAIGKESPQGGRIVIGTQTLEQSLDLCADLLITDLCPMDVLLQRIGRLHRHRRPRPDGFSQPRVIVLCPTEGLDPLTQYAENGLGAHVGGPSLSGVYVDVPGLQATLEQIEDQPVWCIPQMNRALVEAATHPEALEPLAARHGWMGYRQRVVGKALAEMRTAELVMLDRKVPFLDPEQRVLCFPDDEKIRTRLGEEGVILTLPKGILGAFAAPISRIMLPAHWSHGLTGEEQVQVDPGQTIRMTVSDMELHYSPAGLQKGGGNDV